MTESAISPDKLLRRSREALSALAVMFVLGMGANLIGSPEDNNDGARVVAGVVLGLHALVGIGVVVVAVRVWLAARRLGVGARPALWALVVLTVTFLVGVATMLTGNGWLSFLMALGFLVGATLYVQLSAVASRAARVAAA
ncbi:hypothetical protein SPF06_20420 [Sinomonas sp. JGH33]|uniref:Uncharacterized protein n=1 Tax=Sinomonas terricola TaxID=3110330 RepID=A0ABU5TBN5_9MICC|nr:hypothetical protein [Sinomonas sp. JGH33]MEA5457093.1 hypothetical protein [Sinomonas sp. JGH33]